jgi:hypothetical protein
MKEGVGQVMKNNGKGIQDHMNLIKKLEVDYYICILWILRILCILWI